MATIPTLKSGNWSDPTTWDGGILPGVGDIAQAITGHTVTIDQDIEVERLTHTGSGQFLLTGSDTINIIADALYITNSATASLIVLDSSYTAIGSTIAVDSFRSITNAAAGTKAAIETKAGATGSLDITARLMRTGSSAAGGTARSLIHASNTDITVTATELTGITTFPILYSGGSSLTLNISGTIQNNIIQTSGSSPQLLTFNGDMLFTNRTATVFAFGNTAATIIFNGDLTLSNLAGGVTVIIHSIGDITINGDLRCITVSAANPYIVEMNTLNPTTKTLTINGNIYGGHALTTPLTNGGTPILFQGGTLVVNGDIYPGDSNGFLSTINSRDGGDGILALVTTNNGSAITVTGSVYGPRYGGYSSGIGSTAASQMYYKVRLGKPGEVSIINDNMGGRAITGFVQVVEGAIIKYMYGFREHGSNNIVPMIDTLTNVDSDLDPADVRDGVVYDSDEKVGTLVAPDPADVLHGVPVGDSVGSATIKMTDAAAVTGSQIATLAD